MCDFLSSFRQSNFFSHWRTAIGRHLFLSAAEGVNLSSSFYRRRLTVSPEQPVLRVVGEGDGECLQVVGEGRRRDGRRDVGGRQLRLRRLLVVDVDADRVQHPAAQAGHHGAAQSVPVPPPARPRRPSYDRRRRRNALTEAGFNVNNRRKQRRTILT